MHFSVSRPRGEIPDKNLYVGRFNQPVIRIDNHMKIYVALFRGINVGGKNILPMKELVSVLEDLDARNIKTYIQSGNAVFMNPERDTVRLTNSISRAIRKRRGFEPRLLLLGPEDIERAMRKNPFPKAAAEPRALHVGFLASAPEKPNLKALERLKSASERFQLIDKVFYLYAPDGIGKSRLAANVERLLRVPMTDRNWRTVCKIREMAEELS